MLSFSIKGVSTEVLTRLYVCVKANVTIFFNFISNQSNFQKRL